MVIDTVNSRNTKIPELCLSMPETRLDLHLTINKLGRLAGPFGQRPFLEDITWEQASVLVGLFSLVKNKMKATKEGVFPNTFIYHCNPRCSTHLKNCASRLGVFCKLSF